MTPLPLRPQHQEELLLQHLRAFLGILDEATILALRQRLRWVELAGGDTLMHQGERGEALYLLVSGRLRVYAQEPGQPRRILRQIGRGEVVGEMSLYTDEPRSATLVAIRDSLLVSLDKADFNDLLADSPQVSMALTRQIIRRLKGQTAKSVIDQPVTMVLMPISDGVDGAGLAAVLAGQLARHGRVSVLDPASIAQHLAAAAEHAEEEGEASEQRGIAMLLDQIENTHDYVLLVADAQPSRWTEFCTRHADEILLLADARAEPRLHACEQRYLSHRSPHAQAVEILVLLHGDDAVMPSGTAQWLARRPVDGHLHIRPGRPGDIERLGRFQARKAVGLVLSGGGARGFAHLGVYRALREQGIEIDCVGGTSIGSVMGALVATDLPFERVDAEARAAFAGNPTGDLTLIPLVSLFKGQRLRKIVARAVAGAVGEGAHIEDLWKPFFCVATNYSSASEVVLTRGELSRAVLASVSIPGALPPVVMDGDLLSDGGTFNNFPVDVMRRQRGVSTVIGVDLSSGLARRIDFAEMPSQRTLLRDRLRRAEARHYKLPSLATLLINTTVLYSTSRQKEARALTDLYFNPPLERVGLLDWRLYDAVVRRGYEHALQVLAARPATAAAAELR